MRFSLLGRLLFLLVLVFALALPGYGQEATIERGMDQVFVVPVSSPTPAPTVMAREPTPVTTERVFVPLLFTPPRGWATQFSARLDANNFPVNPDTTFNYGINRLYISALAEGAQDLPWRIEASWPDGETMVRAGTIRFPAASVAVYLYYSDNRPLDPGTYRAQFYLNNQLYDEATVTIR